MPWDPLPTNADSEPRPVSSSLDRLVRHLGGPSVSAVGEVFGGWADIVGENVAAHTHPVSVRGGTLVVAVDDPAWATQLRFLEPQILAQVSQSLGSSELVSLQVRVERPST